MPDWLAKSFDSDVNLSLSLLIVRQLTALILGTVVALIYRMIDGRSGGRQAMEMMATLVLLTVLIAMMTAVIGDNIARAFSIVGALSIVRFRTVVEDTRDTAFVICAVAVGLAIGAGHVLIPIVTLPIVAAAGFLFMPREETVRVAVVGAADFELTLRVGTAYANAPDIDNVLKSLVQSARLSAMASARQGAAFEKTWSIRLRSPDDAAKIVSQLSAIEGVQNVDLRQT